MYREQANVVVLPGRDGEFSVMDFHQPFLYRLRKGLIKVREEKGKHTERILHIKDGMAVFSENTLLIFCEKG